MSNGNKWLTTEPEKSYYVYTIKGVNSKTGEPVGYNKFTPVRILGCVNNYTCETHWIPPTEHEGGKLGRWHKFNQGVELDAWQPLPTPLKELNNDEESSL